ncbi:hypothetical protein AGMMS49982_12140 [Bacteroidia bacterium]|nr:hypothetical protein AGMMS49982_12140 [Bacteroidia bacterium]
MNRNNKKIGAITMARNDEFFLNRWIAYYGSQLGEENLYIYLDGLDQQRPSGAGRSHIIAVEKKGIKVVEAEKLRLNFLSDRAAELFKSGYDLVIGVDADEFLVVDPRTAMNLSEYLSHRKIGTSVSGLGLDIGQNLNCESALDEAKPFLEQRAYALVHTRFTKANVIAKPVRWGRGFHRIRGHNFHIDPNLYLLHFGNVDYDTLKAKSESPDIIARGEQKHFIRRRFAVITAISAAKRILAGDKVFDWARVLQTVCRHIYAWNKPAMLGIKWIVKLPERFKNLV